MKTSGCLIYKKLCIIFSESATNGRHDQSAELGEGTPPSNFCQTKPFFLHQESESESEEADDVVDNQDTGQPATPSTTGVRKRGRKSIDDAIADAILEMAAASKMRTTAIQQCNARYSITKCIKELDEMVGVDEKLYLGALDLFNKPVARETFLSLKGDKRLTWLRRKCMPFLIP